MPEYFPTVRDSIKAFLSEIVIGLLVAGLWGFLVDSIWVSIVLFSLLLGLFLLYSRLSGKYRRFFRLMKAGTNGYYYSFDSKTDCAIFHKESEAKKSFRYLGISANSIIELFRKWIDHGPPITEYRFLLMDPESPMLRRQVAFEKGVPPDRDLSLVDANLLKNIDEAVEAEKHVISGMVERLKTLPQFAQGILQIKLHSEFVPWWMYIVDDKKIYLGVLECGVRGQDSPAISISRQPSYASLFDPFSNLWVRMWHQAKYVEKGRGPGPGSHTGPAKNL